MSGSSLLACVKADYAYAATTDEELTINEDDLLYVLEDDDSEWWKVRIKTLPSEDHSSAPSGLVPASYVSPLPSLAEVTSLYAYEPSNDEELAVAEDEPLSLLERDGDWILVSRRGAERGVGYIPATWIDDKAGAEANGETEREPSPAPEPVVAVAPPPAKPSFLPPPTRITATSSPKPVSDARNVQTWNVTVRLLSPSEENMSETGAQEVDAKKKKKKGTLGIGNGALFFASESDKTPVQQHPLNELSSHRTEKDKHLYLDFAGTELHFSVPSKAELNEIIIKLEETGISPAPSRGEDPSPPPVASTSAYRDGGEPHVNGSSTVYATVMYDFTGEAEDELNVVDGERVIVVDSSEDDWWKVQRTDGSSEEGVVPASYVELESNAAGGKEEPIAAAPIPRHPPPAQGEVAKLREEERKQAARAKADADKSTDAVRKSADSKRSAQAPPLAKRPSERDRRDRRPSASEAKPSSSARREEGKKPAGKTRIWRDRTGQFKVEAEFLGIQNGKVRLHKLNGVIIAVPLAKMSVEDTEHLRKLEKRRADDDDDLPLSSAVRPSSSSQAKATESRQAKPKKSDIDWFEFFLNAGCDMDDCTRYQRNFDKDRIDRSVLADLEPGTLRSLGLREGDVIRVMKHIRANHAPQDNPPDTAKSEQMRKDEELARALHERETGERLPASRDGSGLFTNSSGGLKSTRRGRPTGGKTAPDKVSADALSVSADQLGDMVSPISPAPASGLQSSRRSSSTVAVAGGFDDDAWTNRPASKPSTPNPPSPPPPLPAKPAQKVVEAAAPPRASSAAAAPASSTAQEMNEALLAQLGISNRPPSAPVNRTAASGPAEQQQATYQPPANAPRGPLAPVHGNAPLLNPLVPIQTGNLNFVPTRPGGIASPVVPQITGFNMQPQQTGYQPQMLAQPIGYQTPMTMSPMMPNPTGYSQQGYQYPTQRASFSGPSMNHTMDPHAMGRASISGPSYSTGLAPQATGWNAAPQMQQPQMTGYSPAPPQQQQQQPVQQSSAPTRFDPTNVFGSMKSGTFGKDANAAPQAEEKYNALRPQMTGFAPGGVVSGGLVAQPTGVFANWQHNPMAQQQQQQQQYGQPYQQQYY